MSSEITEIDLHFGRRFHEILKVGLLTEYDTDTKIVLLKQPIALSLYIRCRPIICLPHSQDTYS